MVIWCLVFIIYIPERPGMSLPIPYLGLFFSTNSVKSSCGHEFQCARSSLCAGICTQSIVLLLVWPPDASQASSRWLQNGLQWAPSSDLCGVWPPCSVPAGNVTHKLMLKSYLKFKIKKKEGVCFRFKCYIIHLILFHVLEICELWWEETSASSKFRFD